MTKSLLQQVMMKSDTPKAEEIIDTAKLVEAIEKGYTINRITKFQKKKTFAPSTIAYGHGECPRYWYIAFEGAEFDDSADAYAAANMTSGSLSHDRIQKAMIDAGIVKVFTNDKGEETTEFKIISNDPPIFGYGDGILNWDNQEVVLEIKTMPSEGFEYKKMSKKPKAGHLIQLLIYMKILKHEKGVLIYENKNNHELLVLPVKVNNYYIKWVDQAFDWMRAVRKAWENKTLPEKNYRSNSKICKSCPVKRTCAEMEKGDIKIKSLEPLDEALPVV